MRLAISLSAMLLVIPTYAHAATDLIRNGEFENGDTLGWTNVNVYVFRTIGADERRTLAAQIGDVFTGPRADVAPAYVSGSSITGILSQTVKVPSMSMVHLEFSYLVASNQPKAYGNAGLQAFLLKKDGSIIAEWSALRDSRWHTVEFDLGPVLEEQLTIKFVGKGDIVGYTVNLQPMMAVAFVDNVRLVATPPAEWLGFHMVPLAGALSAALILWRGKGLGRQ